MNKTLLVVIIVIVVLAAAYFIYYAMQKPAGYGSVNYTPNTSVPLSAATPPTTTPAGLSASVSIQNFAFNPTPLTIKAGTTVTWTNKDPVPHQIKSTAFNSSPLSQGQTFSFTFSSPGQFSYSCAIHPYMHGQIIVTQ